MRYLWAIILAVGTVAPVAAQEADPAKVKADPYLRATPYGVDQRCGPMAQHLYNQAYINCAAGTRATVPGVVDPGQQSQVIQEQRTFTIDPVRRKPGVPR